ncbi:MAG: site-specific DNA-methyltransferase, partial [Planctomycetota bacterium]
MAKKASRKKKTAKKSVETLTHDEATRRNIPTAELQSVMDEDDQSPIRVAYERRNRDLDPQLVWRGKDEQDWSALVTHAPPLYIQEKVHPKVLVDDLQRQTELREKTRPGAQLDLFADFNGLPDEARTAEFYQHEGNWTNRMILGDSLQVMASLAEREGLRGQVQCIYIDPPYGIKFNSNFQWSTTSRTVTDGKADHITREPEQVKAFRDTWRDGIHSYLTYLRDRLTVARDLLTDSGSIFIQIGDENVHRVRTLLDEIFGEANCISVITYKSAVGMGSAYLDGVATYLVFYAKDRSKLKYRAAFKELTIGEPGATRYLLTEDDAANETRHAAEEAATLFENGAANPFFKQGLTSRSGGDSTRFPVDFQGKKYRPTAGGWRTGEKGMGLVRKANRITVEGRRIAYKRYFGDFPYTSLDNIWDDISGGIKSRSDPKVYVVQTSTSVVERCLLMATDPGDLVLDPTCGSGTTAHVAEQWGRRWITVDTSRVALALARARIMGARYPYYLLADSRDGQQKEAEVTRTAPSEAPTHGDIRQGFVYERVPHITLKSIANNAEIDVIWDKFQETLEPLREQLNQALKQSWEEWEIPREADERWPAKVKNLHAEWWENRITRQKEINTSIAAKADFEYLYDKPYEDRSKVRVAGPFTVESISPHRVLAVDEDDELIDHETAGDGAESDGTDFAQ